MIPTTNPALHIYGAGRCTFQVPFTDVAPPVCIIGRNPRRAKRMCRAAQVGALLLLSPALTLIRCRSPAVSDDPRSRLRTRPRHAHRGHLASPRS